ncbi:unnamed protein product [Lampetra fluviatilis]
MAKRALRRPATCGLRPRDLRCPSPPRGPLTRAPPPPGPSRPPPPRVSPALGPGSHLRTKRARRRPSKRQLSDQPGDTRGSEGGEEGRGEAGPRPPRSFIIPPPAPSHAHRLIRYAPTQAGGGSS